MMCVNAIIAVGFADEFARKPCAISIYSTMCPLHGEFSVKLSITTEAESSGFCGNGRVKFIYGEFDFTRNVK